jgi:hypothetical protein
MKENTDIRCKKVWKRKQEWMNKEWVKEEQVNEELRGIILSGFAVMQGRDESIKKEKDVRFQAKEEDDDSIGEEED